MASFDDTLKTLNGFGKEAAQKARNAADLVKIRTQINSERSKIQELYAAIGTVYFKNHRDDPDDDYKMFFPEIEDAMATIDELEAKAAKLEGTKKCPNCGASVKKGDTFCSKCGAAIPEEPKEEEDEEEVTDNVLVDEESVEVEEEVELDETEGPKNDDPAEE